MTFAGWYGKKGLLGWVGTKLKYLQVQFPLMKKDLKDVVVKVIFI